MKTSGFPSFAAAATEACKNGYWPMFRHDGLQVYANDDGDAIAFVRDGRGLYAITHSVPDDRFTTDSKEIEMKPETNMSESTTSSPAATPESTTTTSEATKKKTSSGTKKTASKSGNGTSKPAAKSAAKTASGAPKASKPAGKPAGKPKAASKPPQKAAATTSAKAKGTTAGKKGAASKASEGSSRDKASGPRPGSGAALVVKLAKAGKTDEEILAIAAKELPKVKSINDPRGVAWYRWQAKKNGWL